MKTYTHTQKQPVIMKAGLLALLMTLTFILFTGNMRLKAQPSANSDYACLEAGTKNYSTADRPNGYIPGEPETANANEITSISFSRNGSYYIIRTMSTSGPNFRVEAWTDVKMTPRNQVSEIRKNVKLPSKLDENVVLMRYAEIKDVIPYEAFKKLNAAGQYEIYQIVTSGEPYAYYEQYFNNWNYKTCFITEHVKISLRFNRKGELVKVNKKSY